MAEAMRKAALLCRNVRRLSTVASQGSFGLVARPLAGKEDASSKLLSSPVWCVESRGTGGALVQSSGTARVGALRFMGFGTFNEEHANAVLPEEEFEVCVISFFECHVTAFSSSNVCKACSGHGSMVLWRQLTLENYEAEFGVFKQVVWCLLFFQFYSFFDQQMQFSLPIMVVVN